MFSRFQSTAAFAAVFLSVLVSEACAIDYGTPVKTGDFPSVGHLQVKTGGNHAVYGTGTLLAPNVVLTAAHVVQEAPTPGSITVKIDLGTDRVFLSKVVVYRTNPHYLNLKGDSVIAEEERNYMDADMLFCSASDLAILLLEKSVPESFGIDYYPLAETDPKKGQEATAVGFGIDEGRKNTRKLSGTLEFLRTHDRALLFRTPKGSAQRTDHGDSGGPLLIKQGNSYKMAAITHGFYTAIRIDGLAPDEYGIYVSIAQHREWIEKVKGQLEKYKAPSGDLYYLARTNQKSPFPAMTGHQVFSLAKIDTPLERLVNRIFTRGINEPIPEDIAKAWQNRYKLPPGMLVPVKAE
ncbi:MAG: trypsin-like serine protease [Planctomycetales bacterium]